MATARRALAGIVGCIIALGLVLVVVPNRASAHGELAQEPFLRQDTVNFLDVQFSTDRLEQGQPLTITGKFKILETWPRELRQPDTAYLSVTVPGPVFVVTHREVGGQLMPMSFHVEKGKVYNFKITLLARTPGTYHVHPALYVEGVSAMLGPGKWITVSPAAEGFKFPVKLTDGTLIPDLQTYKSGFILGFSSLTFLLGVVWLLYWTVPKPTVTRLAITNLIPSADWGSDFGLITRRDVRNVGIIAALAVLLIAGGWAYSKINYPHTIPLQVIRYQAPAEPSPPTLVQVKPLGGRYERASQRLTLTTQVTNISDSPVHLRQLTMANREFVLGTLQEEWQLPLEVTPDAVINPGETKELTIAVAGHFLEDERLVPIGQPREAVAGTLVFEGEGGAVNYESQRWGLTIQ